MKTAQPFSGKAGQYMVYFTPRSCIKASATGPILPSGVQSNVEQYFQKNLFAPARCSQLSAFLHSETASSNGAVRHFRAITSKGAVCSGRALGTPKRSDTRTPDRAKRPARSVAPEKSSAMHPMTVGITRGRFATCAQGHLTRTRGSRPWACCKGSQGAATISHQRHAAALTAGR